MKCSVLSFISLLILCNCQPKTELQKKEKGKVVVDAHKVLLDFDMSRAIDLSESDSVLLSRISWMREDSNHSIDLTADGFVPNVSVKISGDTLQICCSTASKTEREGIAMAGTSHEFILCGGNYEFFDHSWSDVLSPPCKNKHIYSPLYINKAHFQAGDTLRACFTVKVENSCELGGETHTSTAILNYAVNTVVMPR